MTEVSERPIDVIIPTMWRSPSTTVEALSIYTRSSAVGKIVLIDNESKSRPEIPESILTRLTIIDHGHNIYVNPAWNEGASICNAKILCIANDDIVIDEPLLSIMAALDWEAHSIDIIGLDLRAKSEKTDIRKVRINKNSPLGVQFGSFGACMFMPRKNYSHIPNELKIWYGDDFLVHSNQNAFAIKPPFVHGAMSTTIRSFGPESEIHKIIREDIAWAKENLLISFDNIDRHHHSMTVQKSDPVSGTISVDLGCGVNPRNPFNANRVIGIDSQVASKDVTSCWVGFEPLPFDSSTIDFVTAFDFIEHIPRFALREKPFNPFIEAMNEIWRILKPNGVFFARTPAYPSAAAFQDPTQVNIITDQTVSYFAKRPCPDGSFIDPWGLPLGKTYGFKGEFVLVKQWWDTTHLCWKLQAIKKEAL